MANIKSAKKKTKVIAKKTAINKARKNEIKTLEKNFYAAVEEKNVDFAKKSFVIAQKRIAQIGATSTLHKKTASRKISKLAKALKELTASA